MNRIGLKLICCLVYWVAPLDWALAATSSGPGREAFYRCRDERGQTHYADSMPPQCRTVDTEVLNDRGVVVRVIEGTRSLAARAERQVADDAARKVRDAAALRDRMLVETYLAVADIERLRDQRMGLIEAQLLLTEQNIATLREREKRLVQQVQRYRPYNDKPKAPVLPEHIAEEMVNTVNGLAVTQQTIADRRADLKKIELQFADDIARFKQLKGIK